MELRQVVKLFSRCYVTIKSFKQRCKTEWYWLIYLSRYLDQDTAKGPFRSSSQIASFYYQSNQLKVEAIPLSALLKETISELVD